MHYLGLRHRHERLAKHKKEKKTNYTVFLDKLTLIVGIFGPFTVLPQIYTIFSQQSAEGVSTITWLLMFIVTLPWVFYGQAHHDKTIVSSFTLWEIMNMTVVVGSVIY